MKFSTYFTVGEGNLSLEVDLLVNYDYHKGCLGAREDGRPIEPDEPASAEVLRVRALMVSVDPYFSTNWVDVAEHLTGLQVEELEIKAMEHFYEEVHQY